VEALRAEPAVVHAIVGATADADDPTTGHPDVEAAAGRTEDADGLDPALGLDRHPFVDTNRPGAGVRGPWPPDIVDAVARLTHGPAILGVGSAS